MRSSYVAIGLVGLAAVAVSVPLLISGVRVLVAFGWAVTAVCVVLWLCSMVGMLPQKIGWVCLAFAGLALIGTLLGTADVLQKTIAVCGDGICAPNECDGTCADCQPGQCQDGTCVLGFERCDTSSDCECQEGLVCVPDREEANQHGCAPAVCGNGVCEKGEDRFTCCIDCGCETEYSCTNNICLYNVPQISFAPLVIAEEISVTTLAANPSLTNESGIGHPFLFLEVRGEVSDAFNVSVQMQLDDLLEETMLLGKLSRGTAHPVAWYLEHEPSLLNITENRTANITITITYYDGQEVRHVSTWRFPMTLLGRNTLDAWGHVSFFVTPDDIDVKNPEPRRIWQEYQDLPLLPDQKGMQFPLETLQRGGDADDIAVLLASAYYKAGVTVGLVESDHGLFVRFWDKTNFRILDPSKLDVRFEDADAEHFGYAVWDLPQTWEARNSTVLSLS